MKKYISIIMLSILLININSLFADKIKIACVGDSITEGAGIQKAEDKYPAQLQEMLGDKYEVVNFGHSGRTLLTKGDHPYIKSPFYPKALAFNPDIVIIKLGTNDSKAYNWKYSNEMCADLNSLIDSFAALKSKPKIYLAYPCPVYALTTQWGIDEKVVFNGIIPIIRKVAKDRSLKVINFYKALCDNPECFPDNVHPNPQGAKIMAETVEDMILSDK